jgi:AcrR family transcriptional regulator
MMQNKTYKKCLEAAYHEFACHGSQFSFKAFARRHRIPRSTLYYHFTDRDILIKDILLLHQEKSVLYHQNLRKKVKKIIPDLYEFMYTYQIEILFHQQLLKNSDNESFYKLYKSINMTSFEILLPLLKEKFGAHKSDEELILFFNTLTDAWYSRLSPENFNVEAMISLALEILNNTMGLFESENNQSNGSQN